MKMNYREWSKDLLNKKGDYIYAVFTDHLIFRKLPLSDQEIEEIDEKNYLLLEMRIFDQTQEYRLRRSDIGGKFIERFQNDSKIYDKYEYFDEDQYLDIDEKLTQEKQDGKLKCTATGGGTYELPLAKWKNAKITVRNYVAYSSEENQAYIRDWRMVKLVSNDK